MSGVRWVGVIVFFVLLTGFFTWNFMCNPFQLGDPSEEPKRWKPRVFEAFQMDMQGAVNSTLQKTKTDGLNSTGGFIYGYPKATEIYDRAFAAHVKLYSLLYQAWNGTLESFVKRGYFWVSLVAAGVYAGFILFVKRTLGWEAAVVLTVMLALSDWFVFIGRNMYQVYFLRMLPWILSMMLFGFVLDGKRFKLWHFLGIIFFASLLIGMCCNEFITNTVCAVGMGPVFYGVYRRAPWKKIAGWAVVTVLVSMAAIACGVVANAIQSAIHFHSTDKAFLVFHAIINRAYGNDARFAAYDWTAPAEISVFQIFEQYLTLPMMSLPFYQNKFPGYHIFMSLFAFIAAIVPVTLAALVDGRRFPRFERARPMLLAWTAATWWGLGSSLSWAFLMKGHMWHHVHQAALIFYIPYLPMLFALAGKEIGLGIAQGWDWARGSSLRSRSVLAAPAIPPGGTKLPRKRA